MEAKGIRDCSQPGRETPGSSCPTLSCFKWGSSWGKWLAESLTVGPGGRSALHHAEYQVGVARPTLLQKDREVLGAPGPGAWVSSLAHSSAQWYLWGTLSASPSATHFLTLSGWASLAQNTFVPRVHFLTRGKSKCLLAEDTVSTLGLVPFYL